MKNSKANYVRSWVATADQYEALAIQARRDHFEEAKQLVTDIQSKVEELATLASLAQFDGVVAITLGNMHLYTRDADLLALVATNLLKGKEIVFHEKEIKVFVDTEYISII